MYIYCVCMCVCILYVLCTCVCVCVCISYSTISVFDYIMLKTLPTLTSFKSIGSISLGLYQNFLS